MLKDAAEAESSSFDFVLILQPATCSLQTTVDVPYLAVQSTFDHENIPGLVSLLFAGALRRGRLAGAGNAQRSGTHGSDAKDGR